MKVATFATLAVLLASAFAGCLTAGPPEQLAATGVARTAAGPGVQGGVSNAAGAGLHNITVDIRFSSPGFQGPGAGVDIPSGPTDCHAGAHEAIVFEDASLFNGTMIDYGTTCDSVTHQTVAGYWLFTGAIVGCTGSGTLTIPWYLRMDPNPIVVNTEGEVFHAHDILSAPTDSTGFAGVPDLAIDAEYTANPVGITAHGTLKGYILCE